MQTTTNKTLHLLLVIIGVLLANFLFWEEKFGANCLIYSIFWVASLTFIFPASRQSRYFLATAVGAIMSAAFVVWHNSDATKLAFLVSMSTVAGFAQAVELRFLGHAFLQYMANFSSVPRHFFQSFNTEDTEGKPKKSIARWLQMSIIPIAVATVFYILYYFANDKFAAISDRFWRKFSRIFSFDISFEHVFYVLILSFVVGAAFWKAKNFFAEKAVKNLDFLQRKRNNLLKDAYGRTLSSRNHFSFLGLQKEYQQSLMTLGMLNLLLLVVNATDIIYVWTGANVAEVTDLKQYVHEGTYILIACIVLAMLVLFQIFRKNLNFYPKNTMLRVLSLGWLVQNGVLAISVGIRNWQYVTHHGFAYKRVGVFLFLLLVFFGLTTLWLKIRDRHTFSWLLQLNAWALYGLILFNAAVPWDQWITHYNLTATVKSVIDVRWLINEVSTKNVRILEDNLEILKEKPAYPAIDVKSIEMGVTNKRDIFDTEMKRLSWKSWNWADEACK
jgi:hypothetical protein